MITLTNVYVAVPWLIKNDTVFNNLKTDFPEILADLITFKENPNCSCRGRVIKFFSDKLQQDPELLNKYIYNTQELANEITRAEAIAQQNNYSGKILTIAKDEASWKAFSDSMRSKSFRSFSIVEKDDQLVIYII